jgi:hypothetical protein
MLIGFSGQLLNNQKMSRGCFVNVHVVNPVHLNHEGM